MVIRYWMLDIRNLELGTRKWELIEGRSEMAIRGTRTENREPRNEPDHRRCSIFVERKHHPEISGPIGIGQMLSTQDLKSGFFNLGEMKH